MNDSVRLVLFLLYLLVGYSLVAWLLCMTKKLTGVKVPASIVFLLGLVLLYVYMPYQAQCKCASAEGYQRRQRRLRR